MPDNRVRILASLEDKVSSGLDRIRDRLDKTLGKGGAAVFTGNVAAKGLDLIGGSAFKAGQLVGDFIGDSIKAASDLNESASKSEVIFGKSADSVAAFASTADKSLGLSKQAALEATASFGNLFLGTGQTAQGAADLSTKMVSLAGDLASFNNLDPTETLEKLRSGLTGEAEPLRSVGVFLTEAKVKAKAMELGLGDAHGELSEGAKVIARYNIILDETKTAQGDYARTADGAANSQRTLNAEMENAKAVLGEKLLPIEKDWIRFQTDVVVPALGGVVDALNFVEDGLDGWGQAFRAYNDTFDLVGTHFTKTRGILEKNPNLIGDAAQQTSHYAEIMGDAVGGVADKAKRAASDIERAAGRIQNSWSDMTSGLDADRKTVDDYFETIIAKDNLAATNAEIAAQKRILASSTATDAEKRDARVALHQLEADQAKYLQDLAEHGATSSGVFTSTLQGLFKKLKNARGDERDMILSEIRAVQLLAIQAKIAAGAVLTLNERVAVTVAKGGYVTAAGASAGKAAGGTLPSGVTMVGENGPEPIYQQGGGVYVLPHMAAQMGGPRGAAGVTIQFNSTWPPTPAQAREIAALVDEHLGYEFDRAALTGNRV